MPRFYIIFAGKDILLDRGAGEPIIGFIAPRLVAADSELDATNRAKIKLLKQWKLDFNRDNKSGTPQLEPLTIIPIKNPFKRMAFDSELYLYRDSDEREMHIQNCRHAVKRWFRIR